VIKAGVQIERNNNEWHNKNHNDTYRSVVWSRCVCGMLWDTVSHAGSILFYIEYFNYSDIDKRIRAPILILWYDWDWIWAGWYFHILIYQSWFAEYCKSGVATILSIFWHRHFVSI
jgi:hypothetical protein